MPRPTPHPRGTPAPFRTVAPPGRRGLTLLELVVVLVLLGLALALSIPALVSPAGGAVDPLQAVVEGARRQAVRRAESLSLVVRPDGGWVLLAGERQAHETLLSGRLEGIPPTAVLRVRISPLGACWPEPDGAQDGAGGRAAFDPVRCRFAGAPS